MYAGYFSCMNSCCQQRLIYISSMRIIQGEQYLRTVFQDPDGVADRVEDKISWLCSVDARLQYFVRESFSFTDLQKKEAEKHSLKIQHHVHDCVIYRMLIDDIYVCVFVLLQVLQLSRRVYFDEWMVLVNEIYTIYSPFLTSYVPDRANGISWLLSLVAEAKGMYLCTHSY